MGARAIRLAALASFVPCILVAALWIRSFWRCDQLNCFTANFGVVFKTGDGIFAVMFGPQYKGPGALHVAAPCLDYRNYSRNYGGGLPAEMEIAEYRRFRQIGFAFDPNHVQAFLGPPKWFFLRGTVFTFPDGFSWPFLASLPLLLDGGGTWPVIGLGAGGHRACVPLVVTTSAQHPADVRNVERRSPNLCNSSGRSRVI